MEIESFLAQQDQMDLLRVVTAGSVDDGKSTLIGRLLFDSGLVYEDHLTALRDDSVRMGSAGDRIDYSLLLDGLQAEREQGITIDVAYRYFATSRRKFVIADAPGHEQYTRNMVTGASTANLGLLLVDVRKGIVDQTRRHAFIAALLGIRHLVVAVNKMDLVGYDQDRFEAVRSEFAAFAPRLEIQDVHFVPLSALEGDNVVTRSTQMPWYEGSSLLHHLETVHIGSDQNLIDLRFPVQYVHRRTEDFRGYSGTIASGVLRPGDKVLVLPSRQTSRIARLTTFDGDLEAAYPPMAVTVTLEDEIDVSRGDCFVHVGNVPKVSESPEAMLVWLSDVPMATDHRYLVKHAGRVVPAEIAKLRYRTNVHSLRRESAVGLRVNEVGRVLLRPNQPLILDAYRRNRALGSFILIDPLSNATLAAGMFIDRKSAEPAPPGLTEAASPETGTFLSREERCRRLGQRPVTLWFTGPRSSDRHDLAVALERELFERGYAVQVVSPGLEEGGLASGGATAGGLVSLVLQADRLGWISIVNLEDQSDQIPESARSDLAAVSLQEVRVSPQPGSATSSTSEGAPLLVSVVDSDSIGPAVEQVLRWLQGLGAFSSLSPQS